MYKTAIFFKNGKLQENNSHDDNGVLYKSISK